LSIQSLKWEVKGKKLMFRTFLAAAAVVAGLAAPAQAGGFPVEITVDRDGTVTVGAKPRLAITHAREEDWFLAFG
jgi:hypothetical protein